MSEQSRTTLKTYFNTGDKPTEAQFENLIDSCVNKTDDTYAAYGFDSYTETSISSAQILAMGTTPIDLLPVLVNPLQYYEAKIIFEYTAGGDPYTFAADLTINAGGYIIRIDKTLITTTENHWLIISDMCVGTPSGSYTIRKPYDIAQSLQLTTSNSSDPADGDGTILAKIWYNVRIFGTEL
jgi:hypothetical protein